MKYFRTSAIALLAIITNSTLLASGYNCEMNCMNVHKGEVIEGLRIRQAYILDSKIVKVTGEGPSLQSAFDNTRSNCHNLGGNAVTLEHSIGHSKLGDYFLKDITDPTPRNSCERD